MLRPMTKNDVSRVVSVHLASFPGFFLSFLGKQFLYLFYKGVVDAVEGIGFVYLNNAGDPCGFVVGTSNPRGFYSRLLKRDWLKFSLAALGPICRKPSMIPRIARAMLHPGQNPAGGDIAGLFSLGVLPELQGRGAGKELVLAFLKEANRQGCSRVFLTTDSDDNDAVNSFYQKLGFIVQRQYVTYEGRKMNEYWIML